MRYAKGLIFLRFVKEAFLHHAFATYRNVALILKFSDIISHDLALVRDISIYRKSVYIIYIFLFWCVDALDISQM